MSVFERFLTLWVALCIVAGIVLGHFLPNIYHAIGAAEIAHVNLPVAVLIWLMIIPMLVKIDFTALGQVREHYYLGIEVADRAAVVDAYHRARNFGAHVEKPPRTTWKGTPLHELWLKDPDGNLIEIYARLTDAELAAKPEDELPVLLVA